MNPYDRFDAPGKVAGKGANPYDQFDGPSRPQPDLVSQIPGTPAPIKPDRPTGTMDKLLGAGETALSVGSGAIAAPTFFAPCLTANPSGDSAIARPAFPTA